MREILFRGKRKDTEEWEEGIYMPRPNLPNKSRYYIVLIGSAKWYEVDPETVCQYTGLIDKNSRKIFGEDICRDGDNIVRILWSDKYQWGVEILKTDNVLSKGLIFPLWQYDNCKENGYRTLEVIGNIFDNPELDRKTGTLSYPNKYKKNGTPLPANRPNL